MFWLLTSFSVRKLPYFVRNKVKIASDGPDFKDWKTLLKCLMKISQFLTRQFRETRLIIRQIIQRLVNWLRQISMKRFVNDFTSLWTTQNSQNDRNFASRCRNHLKLALFMLRLPDTRYKFYVLFYSLISVANRMHQPQMFILWMKRSFNWSKFRLSYQKTA